MILKKRLKNISKEKYRLIIYYLKKDSNLDCVTTYSIDIFSTKKFLNDCVNYNGKKIKEVLEENGYECYLNSKELENEINEEINKVIKFDYINLEKAVIYLKKYDFTEKSKCDVCGEKHALIDIGNYYSVCTECLENYTSACDFCFERFPIDDINKDSLFRIGEDGEENICEECIENESYGVVRCEYDRCNHPIVWKDCATNVSRDKYEPIYICDRCIDEYEEVYSDPEIEDKDDLEDYYEDLYEDD